MAQALDISKLVQKTTVLPRLYRDEPTQRLLHIATASDLRQLSRKTANSEACPVPEAHFTIRPGHSYVLLISLGGSDAWGGNENGDFYPEGSYKVVDIPEPLPGHPNRVTLGQGLKDRHHTFSEIGAVYRNHKTEVADNVPRSGEIVFERYRDDMHRGELIVELPNSKWHKELEDMDNGIPQMWSQGSGVPKDICRRCSFEFSRKSKARCKHMLLYKLCIPADGIQNGVWCTDATFYDISHVGTNPAAKIACGLIKVASSDIDPDELGSWKPVIPIFNRKAEFQRIHMGRLKPAAPIIARLRAEEEAIVPGEEEEFRNTCSVDPALDLEFVDKCKASDPSDLLSTLSRLKIILTPTQWWRIFSNDNGESADVSGFCSALRDVYRRVTGETDRDFEEDADWLPCRCPDVSSLNRFQPYASSFSPTLKLEIIVKQAATEKYRTPATPTPASRYLAREYARYQTACLTTFADINSSRWCALVNASGM